MRAVALRRPFWPQFIHSMRAKALLRSTIYGVGGVVDLHSDNQHSFFIKRLECGLSKLVGIFRQHIEIFLNPKGASAYAMVTRSEI
jgi:hypothetical protein